MWLTLVFRLLLWIYLLTLTVNLILAPPRVLTTVGYIFGWVSSMLNDQWQVNI